jgi:hypothetical protein
MNRLDRSTVYRVSMAVTLVAGAVVTVYEVIGCYPVRDEAAITMPRDSVQQLTRTTSLSERYKAAVLAHRERYFQRIGLTDLPVEQVLDALRQPYPK